MRILLACEESQAVTIEMRKLGHEAYSSDYCRSGGLNSTKFQFKTNVYEQHKRKIKHFTRH
jgi:hypothetical protein